MYTKPLLLIAGCLLFSLNTLFGQYDFDSLYEASPDFQKEVMAFNDTFDLFNSNEIAEVTFISDFKNLQKTKNDEEYQPAIMRFPYNDKVTVNTEVKIRARGNFRRQTCKYPPILIKFPKKKIKLNQFAEYHKMKMVVDCKKNWQYEQYLINEYLIYRMYNMFSPYSLRVRLMKVKYIDSSGKYEPMTQYAFLIEDQDQLAKRLGGRMLKVKNIHQDSTDYEAMNQLAIFQYMIGNTDWSVPGLHNMKILAFQKSPQDKAKVYAVPYDFDFCGLVNAIYATPPEQLGITQVTDRLFRGFPRTMEEHEKALAVFREKKSTILSLYEDNKLLKSSYKNHCLNFLNDFFDLIDNPSAVKRAMIDQARD